MAQVIESFLLKVRKFQIRHKEAPIGKPIEAI